MRIDLFAALLLLSTPAAAIDEAMLRAAPSRVIAVDGDATGLKLTRELRGGFFQSRVANEGQRGVRVKEVVLFSLPHTLPPETELYGESFQMLSQTAGTLGEPIDLGYNELKHYRIPQPADARVVSSLLTYLRPALRPFCSPSLPRAASPDASTCAPIPSTSCSTLRNSN